MRPESLARIASIAGSHLALLGILALALPTLAVVLWMGVVVDLVPVVVALIATAVVVALMTPIGLWFRGAMRDHGRAEPETSWAWPNVVCRQLLWAVGGIAMAALGLSLVVLWLATLAGAAGIAEAVIITAVVLAVQVPFWRAARRVTERQMKAEEEFKAAAIAEFGDEAAEQFRALERGEHYGGD